MENIVDIKIRNENEISRLLGNIDDNFNLYPEYKNEEIYCKYFKEHSKNFCNNIDELIFKNMNCEVHINLYHIIGVYMYIKNNNQEMSFDDIINKMFDKTNTMTKIKNMILKK